MSTDQYLDAISDCPFFHGLDRSELAELAAAARATTYREGEVLFRPGQSPDALYMVLQGLAEICRRDDARDSFEPVAYVGPGAILGESKIVTGRAFRSLARFPEGGVTLLWSRHEILRRVRSSDGFAMHYLRSLAERVEGSFAVHGRRDARLEGTLDHFELETILQTIVDSRATGVLDIRDEDGSVFGTVFTADRMVGPVSCGELRGADAFLEIILKRPAGGRFCFTPLPAARDTTETFNLSSLLLDAARISDELEHLRSEVPPDTPLRRLSRQLEWRSGDDPELRERIWDSLNGHATGWGDLARQLPFSAGRVASTVRDMLLRRELAADGLEIDRLAEGL